MTGSSNLMAISQTSGAPDIQVIGQVVDNGDTVTVGCDSKSRTGFDKRFACEVPGCNKSYTRLTSLRRHQLNHSPKEIYTCSWPGCTKSFARDDLRLRHVERHRKRSSVNDEAVDESRIPPQPGRSASQEDKFQPPIYNLSSMLPLQEKHNANSVVDHPMKQISNQRWITAIERLRHGYTGTQHFAFLPPAVIRPNECQLPQKKSSGLSGYIQIRPVEVVAGNARKNEPKKIKGSHQFAHRVVCYLTESDNDVHNLLYRDYHASHLCHQPSCINPDHLIVETQEANENRKICSTKVNINTSVNGRDYVLAAVECPHSPPCIIRLVSRAAIEL